MFNVTGRFSSSSPADSCDPWGGLRKAEPRASVPQLRGSREWADNTTCQIQSDHLASGPKRALFYSAGFCWLIDPAGVINLEDSPWAGWRGDQSWLIPCPEDGLYTGDLEEGGRDGLREGEREGGIEGGKEWGRNREKELKDDVQRSVSHFRSKT